VRSGGESIGGLVATFGVSRATVYLMMADRPAAVGMPNGVTGTGSDGPALETGRAVERSQGSSG